MLGRAAPLLLLGLLGAASAPAPSAGTGAIAQETARTSKEGRRVINVWWLPPEYWEASARELKRAEADVEKVRGRLRSYLVVVVLDASVGADGKLAFVEHVALSQDLEVTRNGQKVEPLDRLDPELAKQMPELTYFLQMGLGPLAQGVRLLFFPNVDDKGNAILAGGREGELRVRYRFDKEKDPLELNWHAPLTSVVGPTRCPKGGEPLEASFKFCPWHGVPLR